MPHRYTKHTTAGSWTYQFNAPDRNNVNRPCQVDWSTRARTRLASNTQYAPFLPSTMKALCEQAAYAAVKQARYVTAEILGTPHEHTGSNTGNPGAPDDLHITVGMDTPDVINIPAQNGQPASSRPYPHIVAHVYIDGRGPVGPTMFDNCYVKRITYVMTHSTGQKTEITGMEFNNDTVPAGCTAGNGAPRPVNEFRNAPAWTPLATNVNWAWRWGSGRVTYAVKDAAGVYRATNQTPPAATAPAPTAATTTATTAGPALPRVPMGNTTRYTQNQARNTNGTIDYICLDTQVSPQRWMRYVAGQGWNYA